jgi:hypothetical protein
MMQVSQIHSLVSQHHQHGKLGPERISNELLDLAAAAKQIAEQYTADHLPHSLQLVIRIMMNSLTFTTLYY